MEQDRLLADPVVVERPCVGFERLIEGPASELPL
jgi:hypothetical protein